MHKRLINWILAALLTISASAAVPATGVRSNTGNSAIVWIAQDQARQRAQILTRPAVPGAPVAVFRRYESPAQTRQSAPSLYQRPPPFLR
ncbi:MAG TPA: hypothetical protein VK708_19965 [Bryobacteraceae bacterium]|nr:hypothetical protein [Bryobacteraceae bacterium]